MDKDDFLKNFANQFDDTDADELSFSTDFRKLDEWSSLLALAIMNMIGKKYNIKLSPEEMKTTSTVQELYDLVNSKL